MGIFAFLSAIKKKWPECIIIRKKEGMAEIINQKCKALSFSIDMNQVVHTIAQKTFLYGDYEGTDPAKYAGLRKMSKSERNELLFFEIVKYLDDKLTMVNPEIATLLCMDGVSPISKSNQAKNRRYKSGKQNEQAENETKENATSLFDPTVITPGTKFMENLSLYLRAWINDNKKSFSQILIYSSHLVPGEGEHKIAKLLRNINFHREKMQKKYPGRTLVHVIFGGDADLAVIGLGSKLKRYIMLTEIEYFPEEMRQEHARGLKKNTKDMINHYRTVDITMLKQKISEEMNGNIEDFSLLSTFVGNDFLPAIVSISIEEKGLDILFEIYKEAGYPKIVNEGKIDWNNLLLFLKTYSKREMNLFKNLIPLADKYNAVILKKSSRIISKIVGKKQQEEYNFDFSRFRRLYYENIFYGEYDDSEEKEREQEDNSRYDLDDICEKWLGSLSWLVAYYREGMSGCNPGWYYNYYYTPLISDIVEILEKNLATSKDLKSPFFNFEWNAVTVREPTPTPFEQQVAVIPYKSVKILPKDLRVLITDPKSPIIDLCPIKFVSSLEWKVKDYQTVAFLPFIDQYRISRAIKCIPLDTETEKRNKKEAVRIWNNTE